MPLTHQPPLPSTPIPDFKREPWPDWAILYLKQHYQQQGDSEIAEALSSDPRSLKIERTYKAKQVEKKRDKLDLRRNRDQLHRIQVRNKEAGRYQRAEGFRHSRAVPEGDTRVWKEKMPDDSIRKTMRIKVDGDLISLSSYTWEQANGPIPKGHIIAFRDGNTLNCALDNLLLMSKAENIARNRNLEKGQENQRRANQERYDAQRTLYLDLMEQVKAVEGRIQKLESGERDENYTVEVLGNALRELRQKKNGLMLELYKLPESVKHK